MKLLVCVCALTLSLVVGAGEQSFQSRTVEIDLGDYQFRPNIIELVAGQRIDIKLTNTDLMTAHGFIVQYPVPGRRLNADVPARATIVVEFTPSTPGNYLMYCDKESLFSRSHRARGMQGLFKVTE